MVVCEICKESPPRHRKWCPHVPHLEELAARLELERKLPPFQRHSATSRKAAISMHEKAPTARRLVWETIHARGARGATAEEICRVTGLRGSTVRPRLVELREAGRIVAGGQRKTSSNRFAVVHVAVEE